MFSYDKETGLMRMYGPIGDFEGGISATDMLEALDEMGGRDIRVRLQSEGGNVVDGMSIHNQWQEYPGRIEVEVDALAASIATVFPMAADKIVAFENATVMIHRAWAIAMGNAPAFRATADVLEKMDRDIANIYAKKSGRPADEWLGLMEEETYMAAHFAMEQGLLDGLLDGGEAPPVDTSPVAVVVAPVDGQKAAAVLHEAASTTESRPRLAALEARLAAKRLTLRKHGIE